MSNPVSSPSKAVDVSLRERLERSLHELGEHRQTHVVWRDWLNASPANAAINPHAGSAEFHAGVILDYDRHLANIREAIDALAARPAGCYCAHGYTCGACDEAALSARAEPQAGEWEPTARELLRRLETAQPPNVLMQQLSILGDMAALLRCMFPAAPSPASRARPEAQGEKCPHCGAPCRKEVLMRGGDNGWGDDESRTVYRFSPPADRAPGEVAPAGMVLRECMRCGLAHPAEDRAWSDAVARHLGDTRYGPPITDVLQSVEACIRASVKMWVGDGNG